MDDLSHPLPTDAREVAVWKWERIESYYQRLEHAPLSSENIREWLAEWSQLASILDECYQRLYVETTQNTADREREARFVRFVEEIYPNYQRAEQTLKRKLIASQLEPDGFQVPLRDMRTEVEIFREENLPLVTQEQKLEREYDRIIGSQTVMWDGSELTLIELLPVFQDHDRERRRSAWMLSSQRRLNDRSALNDLWRKFLQIRLQLARNAGFTLADGVGDYRSYRWKQFMRFDYTPDDCLRFHDSIEEVVVPVTARLYEKYRRRLGLDTLRPWDLQGPQGFFTASPTPDEKPLRPFNSAEELEAKCAAIFERVEPQLGVYFEMMRQNKLLDLENRKDKAPGAYCVMFENARQPFIFMNAVGLHEDVQTLLHEAGHAFHGFESSALPYLPQRLAPLEFCEVASMGMEFLSSPYLDGAGGFYSARDAAYARIEKLETALFWWPYMAVADAFQHWAYTHPLDASDPEQCDTQWGKLWDRFMPGVNWEGLEEVKVTGWQHKAHIFTSPFYYVEYGLAQLGAVQIWRNSLNDHAGAVAAYRRALALGGTATLPDLFHAAGARFAFDSETLRQAADLLQQTIEDLEALRV